MSKIKELNWFQVTWAGEYGNMTFEELKKETYGNKVIIWIKNINSYYKLFKSIILTNYLCSFVN